jgi:MFS family permease
MEKPTAVEVDHRSASNHHVDLAVHSLEPTIGVEAELEDLPPGYYRSKYFIGSFFATGMSLFTAVATFALAAPLLGTINEDLGPDPRYLWIALVYNAVVTVCLAPIGRLSDIFGRRYFFIVGGVFGVVGSIVCATAKSIPILIGK